MKRYPKSKKTSFRWLGEVPEHWEVVSFRHVFTESSAVNGDSPVGDMLSVSGYRGIEVKIYDDENRKRTANELENYRVVRPGQLVINTMWLNYAGLGVSWLEGHVSPAYRAYHVSDSLNLKYAHYLMRSGVYVLGYTGHLQGIRPNSLQMPREQMMKWPILVPPAEEQRAIADFLDRETAEIDAFIADQERLIELLTERRTAVHLKNTVEVQGIQTQPTKLGKVLRKLQRTPAANAEVVTAFRSGLVSLRSKTREEGFTFSDLEQGYQGVETGDLVFHGLDGFAGAVGISDSSGKSTPVYHVCAVDEGSDPEFIALLVRALGVTGFLEANAWSVRQRAIDYRNWKKFADLEVRLPDHETQVQLRKQITDSSREVGSAIDDAKQAIELSKERRAALISAAVTGQIDVRTHA